MADRSIFSDPTFRRDIRFFVIAVGLLSTMSVLVMLSSLAKNVAVVMCVANAATADAIPRSCGVALTIFTLEHQQFTVDGDNG
jgi:hypothetical protein